MSSPTHAKSLHSSTRLRSGLNRDPVFDTAERGPFQHPLGDEFVDGPVRAARDDGLSETLAKSVQVISEAVLMSMSSG
jgi:hypothetical protein